MFRRSAVRRARGRGVDVMDIEPRPLRDRARVHGDPSAVIRQSWEETFRALDQSLRIVNGDYPLPRPSATSAMNHYPPSKER